MTTGFSARSNCTSCQICFLVEAHGRAVVDFAVGIIDGYLFVHLVAEVVAGGYIGNVSEVQVVVLFQFETFSQGILHVAQVAELVGKVVLDIDVCFGQDRC